MKNDVWIYAIPAEWDAVDISNSPSWVRAYKACVTGFWKTLPDGTTVYNIASSQGRIEALIEALGSVVKGSDWWEQGTGLDVLDPVEHRTDPDRILSYMNDHVTYDENGDELTRVAATLENPNWGHVFAGQKSIVPNTQHRISAGAFDPDAFSEGFL